FGRHRGITNHYIMRLIDVFASSLARGRVEESRDVVERLWSHFNAGHLGALQSHQDPTGYGGVGIHLWRVSPTAGWRLSAYAILYGPFGGRAKTRVLRHTIGFTDGNGGLPVTIEELKRRHDIV